jgi:tripartite-type tricarboxylate transporter receptor subunit TctC
VTDAGAGATAGDGQGRYAHLAMCSRTRKRTGDQPTRRVLETLVVCMYSTVLRLGIMKLPRRQLLHLAAGAAALPFAPQVAWAQAYPTRPVRIIVPFPAGGSADVGTRIVADYLSRSLGRQFFIENRSGAGGNIGIEAAAKSAPDGYTLLATGNDVVASAPHLNIDPLKDLLPVIQLSRQPVVLVVHPSLGVKSVAELVALAKRAPGLNYALGGGAGRLQHLVIAWFANIAGIKLVEVTYRGGAPAINDLLAGHVKIGSLGLTPLIPHYQAGTLRLLAQSTAERSASLPQVPTYQEAGIQGLVLDQWLGVFVPAGTPPAITSQLNAEINKALTDAAVHDSFLKQAQEPVGGTAEQFLQLFRDDYSKYERLIKELNIKVD